MPISENHRNLFRNPDITDKLWLFQNLVDSGDLNSDGALALLNNIRAELEHSHGQSSSVHVRYAEVMGSLQRQMSEIHLDVTARWQENRSRLQAKDSSADEGPGGEPVHEEEPASKEHAEAKGQAESAEEKEEAETEETEKTEAVEAEAEHVEVESLSELEEMGLSQGMDEEGPPLEAGE